MAGKYYVVWSGRQKGIFDNWNDCERQVKGFAGAKFKSYPTLKEAKVAYGEKPLANSEPNVVSADGKVSLTSGDIAAIEAEVKIFSDGACNPNPGEAGSGIAIYRGDYLSELWYGLYHPVGTNNTAELKGLYHALLAAQVEVAKGRSVAIFCDSLYSINCVTKWGDGWRNNNWQKGGKDLKNVDLIMPMHALYEELRRNIKIHHVNGHVGIQGNELADRMCVLAIKSQEEELRIFKEPLNIEEILLMDSD